MRQSEFEYIIDALIPACKVAGLSYNQTRSILRALANALDLKYTATPYEVSMKYAMDKLENSK